MSLWSAVGKCVHPIEWRIDGSNPVAIFLMHRVGHDRVVFIINFHRFYANNATNR